MFKKPQPLCNREQNLIACKEVLFYQATFSRTTAYGLETISFLGQNLWRDLPLHIKKSQSVKHFKKHIKVWNFICNCRLCKSFVVNLVIFKHIFVLHFLLGVISIDFSSHLLGFS